MSWCSCFPKVTKPTPCSNGGDCVKAPHMLITADNSVGPCGENGVIPITNRVLLSKDCDTPVYEIISHSINLTNVTIDLDEVKFTSNYESDVENSSPLVAKIKYRVFCGELSDTGTIDIIFKKDEACTGDKPEISVTKLNNTEIRIR